MCLRNATAAARGGSVVVREVAERLGNSTLGIEWSFLVEVSIKCWTTIRCAFFNDLTVFRCGRMRLNTNDAQKQRGALSL